MADWERLGRYVVARRVELGYKRRPEFAQALGISVRVLSDIETGRRGNFDPTTVATLENVLGWDTGSVARIAAGGEPTLRPTKSPTPEPWTETEDRAVVRVMRSNIPEARKRQLIALLIAERQNLERDRLNRAEDLIAIFEQGNGNP